MAYSSCVEDFEAAWSLIQEQFSLQTKILEYLRQEYTSREEWAGYCTSQLLNFGCRTTSPNEASNGSIKSYGLSARGSINNVLTISRKFANDRLSTFRDRLNSSSERIVHEYMDMPWLGVSTRILTSWALDLLVEQYRRMVGEVQSRNPRRYPFVQALPACTRSIRLQYGLPCAHEMLALYDQEEVVLVDLTQVHPFWHLEERLVCIEMVNCQSTQLTYMVRTTRIHIYALRHRGSPPRKGDQGTNTAPSATEPARDLAPGPRKASQSGIPAGGRRRYSQWEGGPSLEELDTIDELQDVSQSNAVSGAQENDTDILESTADTVQEGGSGYGTVELTHIIVAGG